MPCYYPASHHAPRQIMTQHSAIPVCSYVYLNAQSYMIQYIETNCVVQNLEIPPT